MLCEVRRLRVTLLLTIDQRNHFAKAPIFDSPAPMCADALMSPRRVGAPRPSIRTSSALSTCTWPHRNALLRQRTPLTTPHVSNLDPCPTASKVGGIWEFTAATSFLPAEPPIDAKNREKPPHSARKCVPPRAQTAARGVLRSADAAPHPGWFVRAQQPHRFRPAVTDPAVGDAATQSRSARVPLPQPVPPPNRAALPAL